MGERFYAHANSKRLRAGLLASHSLQLWYHLRTCLLWGHKALFTADVPGAASLPLEREANEQIFISCGLLTFDWTRVSAVWWVKRAE
jgi:hypothetical protein